VQTLKTAIVVLLMMTVMYGCYVSLTTTPDALPEHIAQLIEESDSFDELAIDAGLPDSMTSLGISDSAAYEAAEPGELEAEDGPAELTFSDGPSTQFSDAGNQSTAGAPQPPAAGNLASLHLPKPSDGSPGITADYDRDSPSTQTAELNLPDPRSLDPSGPAWQGENRTASWDGADAAAAQQPKPATPNIGLANAIRTADRQYAADQAAEALATLSLFYNTPDMTDGERDALLGRLDPLAAAVIYSRKHLLEQPHRVGQAETLMEIAARYELPWQLLANINAVEDPVTVLPGTELKVVRGPFRAEVDLTRRELTIFLGDLYAGRFPISVGSEPAPQEGTYTVQDKQSARTFYDKDGAPIPAGDARNPYGNVWLDLGKQLCIHGSPDRRQPSDLGCISLRGADAEDLYGILSQGSSVTIRR
jgi:lipoprotein-anchoring transpeptidase ErfK/SrfK